MAKAVPKQETPAAQAGVARAAGKTGSNTPAAERPRPKRRRRTVLVLAGSALIATGGAGAWYVLQEEPGAQAAQQQNKPPLFLPLEPFTVNLQPETGDQYLQVGLIVAAKDGAAVDAVKLQMPEIRNRLLLLLSSKRASEISTVPGKQRLSAEIMAEIRESVGLEPLREQITAVYFSAFVIQ